MVSNASPVIKKGTVQTMNFTDAIMKVADGKKISRLIWSSNDEYGFIKDSYLHIHTKGQDNIWKVNDGDILAEDWVLLPEVN